MNFIHPGFVVAGMCAAALPILIHLMLRQRARQLPIGSVRFLKDVLRQHTRRRRIKQWLLLALRTLAVLLLAMLFARPYFDRSHLEGPNREVIVLIDRSASMKAKRGGGKSAYETAWDFARRELTRLDPRTAVHLAVFDAGGVEAVDVDAARQPPPATDAATDFGAAMAWARDLVTVSRRPKRQLIFVSDLQRTGFQRSGHAPFPPDLEVTVHDVGRALTQNLAIEDCRATVTELRPGEKIRVQVRVFNAGALPAKDVKVALELQGPQGRLNAQKSINLGGGGRQAIEFEFSIEQAGIYQGHAAITRDDDLAFDNRRWLAFDARHPDRILLVDGQQGRTVFQNETYYLETALRLRLPQRTMRSFEIERIVWEDGDGFPNLAGFKAILMCNVGRWSAEDARRLSDYVRPGGQAVIFCGDQTQPEHFERLRAAGLIDVAAEDDPAIGPFRIRDWDREHPITAPFSDAQFGDLRSVRFRKLVAMKPTGNSVKVVIQAEEHPLLLEQKLGDGSTLLFASSVDREWSDWPQSRLYVPLTRQMIGYATYQLADRDPVRNVAVGDGIAAGDDKEKAVRETAGIVRDGPNVIVRNIDARESLLDRATEAELREAYGLPALDPRAIDPALAAAIQTPAGAERPDESWTLVLWVLFAVLLFETFMASRIHA